MTQGVDRPETLPGTEPDLLVLGDMHLHDRSTEDDLEAVTAFLRAHTVDCEQTYPGRPAGRAWRLVLSGDFFDLTLITDVPEPGRDAGDYQVSRRERRYGPDPTGPGTAWKIRRLATLYPDLFGAMAAFLAAGHEILFIAGNHDADLHWPEARQALREAVAAFAREGEAPAVMERLGFRRWFYREPGRLHVEHGHQYDPDNVFSDPLAPVDLQAGREIEPTLGRHVSRYLLSKLVGVYDSHGDNELTPWPLLLNVVRKLGPRAPWIILNYYKMAARALLNGFGAGKSIRPGGEGADGADPELSLSGPALRSLRALHAPATMKSRWSIAERLYLVRSLSFALVVLCLASLTLGIVPFAPAGIAPLAVLFATLAVSLRKGNRYVDRVASSCERAAAEISSAQDIPLARRIPFVVMSHTHDPSWRSLGEGTAYINTGAFSGNDGGGAESRSYLVLLRGEKGFEARIQSFQFPI